MLFNLLLMPKILERQIRETYYGTFMTMAEEKNRGRVQIQDNQIVFTDKEETAVYKTGLMNDQSWACGTFEGIWCCLFQQN